jgi:hypothetical protein
VKLDLTKMDSLEVGNDHVLFQTLCEKQAARPREGMS